MTSNPQSAWAKIPVEPVPRTALRPAEAAESLGISARTLADWCNLPGFPVVRIGGCRLIPTEDLRAWLSVKLIEQHESEVPE